jgi:hypothetical protein
MCMWTDGQLPPFAVPALYHGSTFLSQTPNILFYLGPRLGLVPDDEVGRLRVNQTFLTLSDLYVHLSALIVAISRCILMILAALSSAFSSQNEIHDTHHPIAVGDYYENQKEAAFRRSIDLRLNRIPKFLSCVTSPSPSVRELPQLTPSVSCPSLQQLLRPTRHLSLRPALPCRQQAQLCRSHALEHRRRA